jgi:hypothetical protein
MIYALIGLAILAGLLFFLLFGAFRKNSGLIVVNARLRSELANMRQNELVIDLMLAEYALPPTVEPLTLIQRLQYILSKYNKTLIRTTTFTVDLDKIEPNKTFSHSKYSQDEPDAKSRNEATKGT